MVMHSFSEGTKNILAALVYWSVLFMMVYIQVALALAKAKT